ncbi:hypothetical protein ACQV5M_08815 [Leptospira sp. SA-E8]|uniref:hypothetical protein n=1 Tax=Leptospira sp. SA-E8 TaxID=3422259 RepID=UPI003EB75235
MKGSFHFISLCLMCFTSTLHAEPGRKGSFFFEFTYGEGLSYPYAKPHKYDSEIMNKENSYNNLDDSIGNLVWNTGTNQEKMESLYVYDHSPKPKVSGQNYSFLFEYVFSNRIGIGLTAMNSDFQGSNLTFTRDTSMFYLVALDNSLGGGNFSTADLRDLQILSPYFTYRDNNLLKIRTFGLNIAYHFLENSSFDPYIRLVFAAGKENVTHSEVYQTTVSIGSRYLFTNNVYVLAEISGNNYDAYSTNRNGLYVINRSYGYAWTLQEYTGKVGAGIKF